MTTCTKIKFVLDATEAGGEVFKTLFRLGDDATTIVHGFFPDKSGILVTGLGGTTFTLQQVHSLLVDFLKGSERPEEYFLVSSQHDALVLDVSFSDRQGGETERKGADKAKKGELPAELLQLKKTLAEELCAQDQDTGLYLLRGIVWIWCILHSCELYMH